MEGETEEIMVVIITEKPSVAREYAKAIRLKTAGERKDGYVEGTSYLFPDSKVIITWAVGHLIGMCTPDKYDEIYKKWSLESLPFLPQTYRYEVLPSTAKQFAVIKNIYDELKFGVPGDTLFLAGDAAREGIYIQYLILQHTSLNLLNNPPVDIKVVWLDSFTESEILRGLKDAKPVSEYANMIKEGVTRGIEDYMVGMNFSRLLSCKFGREFNAKIGAASWTPLAIGRVMTCVMAMVVEREREIRNFTETPFYRITADTGFETQWKAVSTSAFFQSPLLYDESGFKEKNNAELLLGSLEKDKHLTVTGLESKEEKKYAPLLFNLAELQLHCSKKYKISPDQTLSVAQSLYEKKLCTYPRTDARVLSTAVAKEITTTLQGLKRDGTKVGIVDRILSNGWEKRILQSKYVDDAKISDHYAFIPTGDKNDALASLSELEKAVYEDVVNRFLAIFLPPAVYTKVDVELSHSFTEKFFASTKALKEIGYLECAEKPDDDKEGNALNPTLTGLKEGDELEATFQIKEGKTTPPKRYTTGTLIIAMENAGKLIEEEELREQLKGVGIGTSATRAATITKLIQNGYLCLNKKTQVITPGVAGECCYDICLQAGLKDFLSPKISAQWDMALEQIRNGQRDYMEYRKLLENYVNQMVSYVKGLSSGISYEKTANVPMCPRCGKGQIKAGEKNYYCTEHKNGCEFSVSKIIYGAAITNADVLALISGKKTRPIEFEKDGKKFTKCLLYNKQEDRISFVDEMVCPLCGKGVFIDDAKISCRGKCGFILWKTCRGVTLTPGQCKKLMEGKKTELLTLKKKDGSTYEAYLYYNKEKKSVDASFPRKKKETTE